MPSSRGVTQSPEFDHGARNLRLHGVHVVHQVRRRHQRRHVDGGDEQQR